MTPEATARHHIVGAGPRERRAQRTTLLPTTGELAGGAGLLTTAHGTIEDLVRLRYNWVVRGGLDRRLAPCRSRRDDHIRGRQLGLRWPGQALLFWSDYRVLRRRLLNSGRRFHAIIEPKGISNLRCTEQLCGPGH